MHHEKCTGAPGSAAAAQLHHVATGWIPLCQLKQLVLVSALLDHRVGTHASPELTSSHGHLSALRADYSGLGGFQALQKMLLLSPSQWENSSSSEDCSTPAPLPPQSYRCLWKSKNLISEGRDTPLQRAGKKSRLISLAL